MSKFFYKYWWLFYILLFSLIGLLIYALLWTVNFKPYQKIINNNHYLQYKDTINKSSHDTIYYDSIYVESSELKATKELVEGKDRYIKLLEEQIEQCNISQKKAIVQCNAKVESGGQGHTETTHNLGNVPGKVVINYNMNNLPDKIEVIYNGKIVATSNQMVSGVGQLSFDYQPTSGKPQFCSVRISAPESGTVWEYVVNCPQ
ncbi:hypothetical protein ACTS9T_03660 [Empedobacter falsenii]